MADQSIKAAIISAYQQYLGRTPTDDELDQSGHLTDPQGWQHAIEDIKGSPEAYAYSHRQKQDTPPPGGGGGGGGGGGDGTDIRSRLEAVYKKHNLDPSNPGSGLGNIDYFLGRAGQTGNDPNYWSDRLEQEITAWQGGGRGGLIPNEGGTDLTGQGMASYNTLSPLLRPWTTEFSYPNWAPPGQFKPPDAFQAPTGLTEQNDPGYQARLNLGEQALQRSAAAQGTLLTGGTLRDINSFAQDYASNEYGNVYNRALTGWTTNYNKALTDYTTTYNASLNDWTTNYNKAFNEYQQSYNIYENNQANQYNRLANLAGLGQVATSNLNSAGLGYAGLQAQTLGGLGSSLAGLYGAQGNAQAAGLVGSSNAWSGMLNNMGNMAYMYQFLNKSSYQRPGQ